MLGAHGDAATAAMARSEMIQMVATGAGQTTCKQVNNHDSDHTLGANNEAETADDTADGAQRDA